MKILIPVLQFGKSGGFRVLSQLANCWIKKGHSVSFISPISNMLPYFPTEADIIWVDTEGNKCSEMMLIEETKYSMFQRWKAIYRGLNELKSSFDIILANHSLSTYPIFFSNIKGNKFYYIQAYEPEYYRSFKGIKNIILSFLSWFSYFLNFKKIVNADLYRRYKNITAHMVVYPGIDFEIFCPKEKKSSTDIILGCIGRVETYKGTAYVLDAFMLAYEQNPNLILHVAFGNKEIENMHKAIRVITPKNDEELSEFYNSLDILIAAGTVQLGAIHYPVIEAMACGIPVITTGYFPATTHNAWIVPIKNYNAITTSIFAILSNKDTRQKKIAGGHESVKQFNWDIVSTKMYSYFKSA